MLKNVRITSPMGIDQLKEFLPPGDNFPSAEDFASALKELMRTNPTSVYYATLMETEGELTFKDRLHAFILAYIHPSHRFVVVQRFSTPLTTDNKSLDNFVLRFLTWCEQSEVEEVRAETTAMDEVLLNRYGFGIYSLTRSLKLNDESFQTIVALAKGLPNVTT